MNIEQLRKSGNRVRVCHLRRVLMMEIHRNKFRQVERFMSRSEIEELIARNIPHIVSLFGGFTRVEITTPDGETYTGTATESRRYQFNRKIAITTAVGRAMKKMSATTQLAVAN